MPLDAAIASRVAVVRLPPGKQMEDDRDHIERAKRIERDPAAAAELPDDELEEELTLSAASPGRSRFGRFVALLIERTRRGKR